MDLTKFADEYWAAKDDRVDYDRLELYIRHIPQGAEVLVVDGGPGMLAALIRKRGFSVCMTDLSQHAVERARAKRLVAHQLDTDDAPLPFAAERFDCVISDSAIEHRYYPERAVRECVRVLRPGGVFLVMVPNIGHWRHRAQMLRGRLPTVPHTATDASHLRFFGLADIRRMLTRQPLTIVGVEGAPSLWVRGLYPKFMRAPGIGTLYRQLTRLRPSFFARDLLLVGRKLGGS